MHYYLKSVIIKKEMLLQNKDRAYPDGSQQPRGGQRGMALAAVAKCAGMYARLARCPRKHSDI